MPVLEIHRGGGRIETRELTRESPLLVGRMASNDIRIEADGVAPVHCRIGWNHKQVEVAAATASGVEWNGATVQQALLSPGDVIRVGEVEIVLHEQPPHRVEVVDEPPEPLRLETPGPAAVSEMQSSAIALKAITEDELPVRSFHFSDHTSGRTGTPVPAGPEPKSTPPVEPRSGSGVARRPPGMDRVAQVALDLDDMAREETLAAPISRQSPERGLAASAARLRESLQSRQRRPGEQDVTRSPLIIGLGIGSLVLLLAAATIWFVLSREAAQREFATAQGHLEGGLYEQAITEFRQFLQDRPRHALADEARQGIARAQVEQPLSGGSPAWDAALAALTEYISKFRDRKEFQDPESPLRRYVYQTADRIALGAAENARTIRKRSPLAASAEAVKLLEVYSPSESRPVERLAEIARATRAAESAILQQETFDEVARGLDGALTAETPLAALPEYRRLLDRYPAAADYKPLRDRVRKTLDLERRQVARDETPRAPERADAARPPLPQVTLSRRLRTRSDVASTGAVALALAADALFGLEAATGEPLWKRVIGLDPPFFPLTVAAGAPAVLAYDGGAGALILLEQKSGALIWKQALSGTPVGAPLVFEGQALVVTSVGLLEQIDVQSGVASSRLKFSQGLSGPPVVSLSGERLYVPGQADVLYVLSRRPLGCEQAVWLGQGPGAIAAPALMMRTYLVLAENDRADSARLRLFDTTDEKQPPRFLAEQRLAGLVRDALAVRGKQLVVPSTPERLAAFTVAETGDDQALALTATYQVKDPHGGPLFATVGPDDQLWMTSTALRRFTISRDALLPDKQELAVGLATQPLQLSGDSLYVGRRPAYSAAVLFSEADRLRMTAQWQTALGAAVRECTTPAPDGSTLAVTSLGDLFQVSPARVTRGGFEMQGLNQVDVPAGTADSLVATRLSDGRLAISCGGPAARLWLAGNDGVPREIPLPEPLQAEPTLLGPGLLLPLAGRLRLVGRSGDSAQPIAEDLPAPVSESQSAAWRSVTALDDTQALALDARGRLSRLQFRSAPVPHLAEVTHWDAGQSVDQPLAAGAGRVLIADASGRLSLLDASSFESRGELFLDQPASRAPLIAGTQAFIESNGSRLTACDVSGSLAKQWEVPLAAPLAGPPLLSGGRLVLALTDGQALTIDPASGKVARTIPLGQLLAFGPQQWGNEVVVGALDGSLIAITTILEPAP